MPISKKSELTKLIQESIPAVEMAFPHCDWLFLNLSIKNCEASEQQKVLAKLDYGFSKLTKHKDWPATGWIKTIKVHEDRGLLPVHHIYVQSLLMIKPQFFNVTDEEWSSMWQKALKLTYRPIIYQNWVEPKANRSKAYTALTSVFNHMLKEGLFSNSLRLSTGGKLSDLNALNNAKKQHKFTNPSVCIP